MVSSSRPFPLLLSAALLTTLCVATTRAQQAATPPAPPISNGNLEVDADKNLWPDAWDRADAVTWEAETENGQSNHFLRITQPEPDKFTSIYCLIPLRADAPNLQLSFRARTRNVQRGKENYHDARFIFHFKNEARAVVNPDPGPIVLPDDSNGWTQQSVKLTVPPGATVLEMMPTLFQTKSGTLDIDDVQLVPVAADAPANPAPVAVEPPAKLLPELRVVGNQIQSKDGVTVWLQGVNVPSLDWMPEGDHVLGSVKVATGEWGANVVRLPVNDDYWFGGHERQHDKGQEYRALVDSCVQAIARRGAYVVLDLHKYRALQPSALEFWRAVAAQYKNNPAVLFDIINEPHDITWDVWQNGGTVEDSPASNGKPAVTYQSPGMQRAIDEIRATGARNLIVAGGLDWAYDLTGILNGHALTDKTGNGIVYSAHIYPWKRDWQNKVLAIAAKYPVILGEVGCDPRPVADNPNENAYTWAPDMMGTIQKYHLHWTAWSFHTDATPRVLQDWDYNPTPFWGAWVKAALAGAQFGVVKTR